MCCFYFHQPFTYPEEAGLPIGGSKFSRYVMLEVHYNNPELKEGTLKVIYDVFIIIFFFLENNLLPLKFSQFHLY